MANAFDELDAQAAPVNAFDALDAKANAFDQFDQAQAQKQPNAFDQLDAKNIAPATQEAIDQTRPTQWWQAGATPEQIAAHKSDIESQGLRPWLQSEGINPGILGMGPEQLAQTTDPYYNKAESTAAMAAARAAFERHPVSTVRENVTAAPILSLPKPQGPGVVAGATRGLESAGEALTSPENLALMASIGGAPKALQTAAGAFFVAMMAKQAPEHIQQFMEAKTPGDKAEAATEFLTNLALMEATRIHTMRDAGAMTFEERNQFIQQGIERQQIRLDEAKALSSEVEPALPKLPGPTQDNVRRIIAKQATGQELSPNDRATMAQVRSFASQSKAGQTDADFTASTEQPQGTTPPPTPEAAGETTGSPPAQGGRSSLFSQAADEIGVKLPDGVPEPAPEVAKSVEETPTEETVSRQSPLDQLKALQADAEPTDAAAEKMANDLQKLGRVNRDSTKAVAQELKYYSDAERQQLQQHLKTDDADPATLATAITGRDVLKEKATVSEYLDEPAGKEGRGHPTADVAKEAFGEDYTGGPGAMGPREAAQMAAEQNKVSIANADVNARRAAEGKPILESEERKANPVTWAEAEQRLKDHPAAGQDLVKALNDGIKTSVSDADGALLTHEMITAKNLRDQWRERAGAADSSPEERTEAQTNWQKYEKQLEDVDTAARKAGTQAGRALQIRQMQINDDYTPAAMESRLRAAKQGTLTEKEISDVVQAHARISELEKQLEDKQKQSLYEHAKASFDKLVKDTFAEAKKAAKSGGTITDFLNDKAAEAKARIIARRGKLNVTVDPLNVAGLVDEAIIGASHIANGIKDFAGWSKAMLDDFGDRIKPYLKDLFDSSTKFHDENTKVFDKAKAGDTPKKSSEEVALQRYKTSLVNRTADLQEKMAAGDYTKTPRNKVQLDADAEKLKANYEREKLKFDTKVEEQRLANRTTSQKFWDRFVGIERAMKLSSDVVIGKLTSAAIAREFLLAPAYEATGGLVSKFLPRLAERAPVEGGFSLQALAKAKADFFTKGMKDAWDNLRMRKSDLEVTYGNKKHLAAPEWYEYMGFLHSALKAPVKRSAFRFAMEKQIEWAEREGKDTNDPQVMKNLAQRSYLEAQKAIFQQDNALASMFTAGINSVRNNPKFGNYGPALARLGNFLVPVVKVPTNIAGEVAVGVHGTVSGLARAGLAYAKGIESLPHDQADAIMSQLKRGLVGNAILLTGYLGYKSIGGFYQRNDKRPSTDTQPETYKVGSLTLPKFTGHSVAGMLLNIGATLRREQEKNGFESGVRAATQGEVNQLPLIPVVTNITEALGSDHALQKWINGMITSTVTPGLSQHMAKVIDTPGSFPKNAFVPANPRQPQNAFDAIKVGVPGLRQQVQKPKRR